MNNTIYNLTFQSGYIPIYEPINLSKCQISERLLLDGLSKLPTKIFIVLLIIFIALNIRLLILPKYNIINNYLGYFDTFILGAFAIALLLLYVYTFSTEHIYRNLFIGIVILFGSLFLANYIYKYTSKVKQ